MRISNQYIRNMLHPIWRNIFRFKYDADLSNCQYRGPTMIAEAGEQLNLDKNVKILDVMAGTGMVARKVSLFLLKWTQGPA